MTTNGHHPPAGLQVDPAHVIPAPPPAPTAADAQRAYGMPTAPPVVAQPQPAQPVAQPAPQPQLEPQIVMVQAPRRSPWAWINAKQNRQLGAISAGFLVAALALPAYRWVRSPDTPTVDPQVATLTSQVDALTEQLATASRPEPLEVNPLNVLPCAVTNDARRFIGVGGDGSLNLAQSERIARQVQAAFMQGQADYTRFVIRTGQSVTQLEVATEGRGVQLFDCGRPAAPAPSTTVPAATPTTGGR